MPRHENGPRKWKARENGIALASACVAGALLLAAAGTAFAQQASTLNGPPVQVIPYVSEPGVPAVNVDPGTPNPFPDDTGSTGGTGSGGTGGTVSDTPALGTMMNQTWGSQAVTIAQGLGINPSALAGLCAAESGCQNIPNGSGGSATGPFQMIPTTFTSMYAAAVADDPALAQSTTGSINDPASQAAAAAELIKQEATTLQNAGVANPTWLDVRGGYAFGNTYMPAVAQAPDDEPLGQILTGWSARTYQMNGLTPATTVGQWRVQQSGRAGSAAGQSVLT